MGGVTLGPIMSDGTDPEMFLLMVKFQKYLLIYPIWIVWDTTLIKVYYIYIIYLENQLLLISINFTPKTSHSCLKKGYTRFSRYMYILYYPNIPPPKDNSGLPKNFLPHHFFWTRGERGATKTRIFFVRSKGLGHKVGPYEL